jgi:putative NADPH-quinone reductase
MSVLVIPGHPDPGSFNHALAAVVCDALARAGHRVVFHDLYAEGFDPRLPATEISETANLPAVIARHCWELRAAEGIVVVHPNWWGQPPAVLKGWIDRVFRPQVASRFDEGDGGEGIPVGLLKARAALILNTANTPPGREAQVFGDPLQALWERCIFNLCGVNQVARRTFAVVVTSTLDQRQRWLKEAREMAMALFGDPVS